MSICRKIVVKNEAGTFYYTFPRDAELDMPGVQNLDLRVLFSSPSQKLDFALAQSDFAIATQRNPDKERLHATVLELRSQGMSYREIAQVVGLNCTRIQQIMKPNRELTR
jgi:DNA-directed RNA polymerase specialized sigma24 family protein